MLKYGKICEVDYTKGRARVDFDDLNIVSGWLSLPTVSTRSTKHFVPLEINTQVAVMMHKDGEQGEIVKAVWSSEDTPPSWANKDTQGVQFSDGTTITYNKLTHKLIIKVEGGIIEFNSGALGGLVKVDAILSAINRLEDRMKSHQHIAQGSPTTNDPSTNPTFDNTSKNDIENTNIKQ